MASTLRLHLIRHGKATTQHLSKPTEEGSLAPSGDYDALHSLGVEQAALLGAVLAERGQTFERVFCGPLQRQLSTLSHMRRGALPHGVQWPAESVRADLREIGLDTLFTQELPRFIEQNASVAALWAEYLAHGPQHVAAPDSPLARILEIIANEWRADRVSRAEVETWSVFRARAVAELLAIVAECAGATDVAVISSMGVISCMLDAAVRPPASERGLMPFHWLYTASVSVLSWDGRALTVEAFNRVDHLRDRSAVLTVL